jgi:ubiquinone/menaquinone biosynthesis C-methylase UbiE
LADVHNKLYNPNGKQRAGEYRLPYRDADFDFVFLCSVFTHMLPPDLEHYFSEISRVLKPGGRSVISYFLLNAESSLAMADGRNVIRPDHVFQGGVCRVADVESPETTVAYEEAYIRDLYLRHGLNVCEITYGFWSGRQDLVRSLQDVVIAVRETRP